MKKSTKLKICDRGLLPVLVLMLASSVQLEEWWLGMGFIWTHLALGIVFFALITWHIQLHFNWQKWIDKFRKLKSSVTRWLAIFAALTLLTAIIATIHMFFTWHHSPIGGIHGKLGFIFLFLAIWHIIKRFKFHKR